MKKVYFAHATKGDFRSELYTPLRKAKIDFDLILPHEKQDAPVDSKKLISTSDLLVAEVSEPSHGVGIELGWANIQNVPILALYKKGLKVSSSIGVVAKEVIEYEHADQIPELISEFLKKV